MCRIQCFAFGLVTLGPSRPGLAWAQDATHPLAHGTHFPESAADPSPRAREHFAAGVAHVEDPSGPRYEDAYREFKAAYAASPVHTIALNLGYCAFFLERDAEALEMYERYLSKAAASELAQDQRAQLERDVRSLKAGLVRVSIKVNPAQATLIDTRMPTQGGVVVNRYPVEGGIAQLGIHPGTHKLTVTAAGYRPQSWEFEAQPASTHSHDFLLEANLAPQRARVSGAVIVPAAGQRETSPMVYASAIATGVFVFGAVATGIVAQYKKNQFDAINDGAQIGRARELRDAAKGYALVADIGLGAAVISAGAAAYFYLVDQSPSEKHPQRSRWSFTPTASSALLGMQLKADF